MKIFSEKINYALSAIFELGKNYDRGFIQTKQIAKIQNIPKSFLEQLLIILKNTGLVESMRGAQGGYKLTRPPNKIRIIELIEAIESPLTIVDYSKNSEIFKIYWEKKETAFKNLFDDTLEDLINEERKLNKSLFYQI
ncbi:MAG: Rrf2 family transcriptional regulator [Promethearchaeota archaeon]|nr:MAG: Rrf2 family transcriptional regulator [Candidatus Lokiarchaeota archaeon]